MLNFSKLNQTKFNSEPQSLATNITVNVSTLNISSQTKVPVTTIQNPIVQRSQDATGSGVRKSRKKLTRKEYNVDGLKGFLIRRNFTITSNVKISFSIETLGRIKTLNRLDLDVSGITGKKRHSGSFSIIAGKRCLFSTNYSLKATKKLNFSNRLVLRGKKGFLQSASKDIDGEIDILHAISLLYLSKELD